MSSEPPQMSQSSNTLHRVLELHECARYERYADGQATCRCPTCQNGLAGFFDTFLRIHDADYQAAARSDISTCTSYFPGDGCAKSFARELLEAFYQELRHMRAHPADFFSTITVFRMDTMADIIADGSNFCEKQKAIWATLIAEVHGELASIKQK